MLLSRSFIAAALLTLGGVLASSTAMRQPLEPRSVPRLQPLHVAAYTIPDRSTLTRYPGP